jgi:hypothetical protein
MQVLTTGEGADPQLYELLANLSRLPHPPGTDTLAAFVLGRLAEVGVLQRRCRQLAELAGDAANVRAAAAAAGRALQRSLEQLAAALGQPLPGRLVGQQREQADQEPGAKVVLQGALRLLRGQVGGAAVEPRPALSWGRCGAPGTWPAGRWLLPMAALLLRRW